jgi:uncharacterized small protein (TIGR04563 family)
MSGAKQKQSLYIPEEMLAEMIREATRMDRSLSWVVQRAWRIARGSIKEILSVNDYPRARRALDED